MWFKIKIQREDMKGNMGEWKLSEKESYEKEKNTVLIP